MRKMTPAHFIENFKTAIENAGAGCFILLDDCFTADMKGHVKPVCEMIIAEKLPVQVVFTGRVDNLYKNIQMLPLISKAGLNVAFIGVEAVFDETLAEMNKKGGYGRKEIETVVAALKDNGIEPFVSLVFGYPNETPDMVMKTIDYVNSLRAAAALINIATPYPGSNLHKRAVANHAILTGNYDRYDGIHRVWKDVPETTPNAVADARRNFFLRPEFIRKTFNACLDSIDIRVFIGGGMLISDIGHPERSRPRTTGEWMRLLEGLRLVLHDRFSPNVDYNCIFRIKLPGNRIFLTVKGGQIEKFSDKEQSFDVSLDMDEKTLIDLFALGSLDILSALILNRVQISPKEIDKVLDFIAWFTRVQDTLRWIGISKINIPLVRYRLQAEIQENQQVQRHFKQVFPGKSTLFIGNKSPGGLMIHFSEGKILDVLPTRGYPASQNFEKIIDIPQLKAMMCGGYENLAEIVMKKDFKCISPPECGSLLEPEAFFASLPAKFVEEKAGNVDILIQYSIKQDHREDNWWISIKNKQLDLDRGVPGVLPHVSIIIKKEDFIKLINGYINAMELYVNGNISYKGAPFVMIQFAKCFDGLYGVPDIDRINSQPGAVGIKEGEYA
jgi:hypothetical protein